MIYPLYFIISFIRCVQKIKKSHQRGESCIIQKKLRGMRDDQSQGCGKRYPRLYAEDEVPEEELEQQQQVCCEIRLFRDTMSNTVQGFNLAMAKFGDF